MRTRVITAILSILVVLSAVLCTNIWPLFILAAAATAVGSAELGQLGHGSKISFPMLGVLAMCMLGGYLGGAFPGWTASEFMGRNAGLLGAGLIGAFLLLTNLAGRLAREAASLWIGAPLASLVLLKAASTPASQGFWHWSSPILLALLPLWAGDTAALFIGKKFGRHKLAPTISPGKTVEGAVGNLAACVLAAWGVGSAIQISPVLSLACGLACGILGQVGDLFESALKRSADKKDSGTLLPGHGGVLDRIDSLLLAGPAVAAILLLGGGIVDLSIK